MVPLHSRWEAIIKAKRVDTLMNATGTELNVNMNLPGDAVREEISVCHVTTEIRIRVHMQAAKLLNR